MDQSIPGRKSRINALAFRNVIVALMEGTPYTYAELAEVSGLADKTVRGLLLPFRQRPRMVRIGAWQEDRIGRANTPAFTWGSEPDAPRRAVSARVRRAQYRARQKMLRMIHATTGPRSEPA